MMEIKRMCRDRSHWRNWTEEVNPTPNGTWDGRRRRRRRRRRSRRRIRRRGRRRRRKSKSCKSRS